MKRIVLFLISFSVLVFGVSAPAQAAPKSIKLSKSQVKFVGPYQCGLVKGTWVPGRQVKSTKKAKFFIPYTSYAADSSKQAAKFTKKANKVKGKSKAANKKRAKLNGQAAKATRQANDYTAKVNEQANACSTGVYALPMMSMPVSTMPLFPGERICENKPLIINLSGARGLAVTSGGGGMSTSTYCVPRALLTQRSFQGDGSVASRSVDSESNLFAVTQNGALRQAFNAQVNVSNVFISPTSDIYVSFNGRTNVENLDAPWTQGSGCVLAKVNKGDGTLSCIDTELDWLSWTGGWYSNNNPSIQFTSDGSIYYTGYISSSSNNGMSNYVLRKYQGGVASTVVNGAGNFQIYDFAVLESGDVAVKGWTTSTNTNWFRMFWSAGGFESINRNGYSEFMRVLSDGNLYFSSNNWSETGYGQGVGIHKVNLLGNKTLSTTRFLANCNSWGGCDVAPPVIDSSDECIAAGEQYAGPCGGGFYNAVSLRLNDGSDYLVSDGVVFKLTLGANPGFSIIPTPSMGSIIKVQAAGSNIVLLGDDDSGRQRLELLNPLNAVERKLLPSVAEDIDLFHMSYRASDDQLFANLLRSSDGKIYVAQIDLASTNVAYSPSLTAKLEDLLAFTD
jgi:hypothetical protein